jgi:hypothetical protein
VPFAESAPFCRIDPFVESVPFRLLVDTSDRDSIINM